MASEQDYFEAQSYAHEGCEVWCGRTIMGVQCPVSVSPDYCRIEYTRNNETEVDYCDPIDAEEHVKTLRMNGAWIHDVSYGKRRGNNE